MNAPSGRSRFCRSSSAAPRVLVSAPVARPWTTRAASSQPTPSLTRNSTIATASSRKATTSTGRRPTWSDSAPTTSSEASRANA